jgi:S1-C subfamily serine protease
MPRAKQAELSAEVVRRVRAAIVTVEKEPDNTGQGFLMCGGLILTAAHCIPWGERDVVSLVLGDPLLVYVRAPGGDRFRAELVAADPVTDVAVLGAVDDIYPPTDYERFSDFEATTPALTLYTGEDAGSGAVPMWVFTHRGKEIPASPAFAGTANPPPAQTSSPKLYLETRDRIIGGTSGGPIVTSAGEVVALVSSFSEVTGNDRTDGPQPWLKWALPRWIVEQLAPGE